MTTHCHDRGRRNGVATVWVLVVFAAVTTLSATAVGQFASARRAADRHRDGLQAAWLARSGVELAAARLLADGAYVGETTSPLPNAELRVAVTKEAGDVYRVEGRARFPTDGAAAVRTAVHHFKRAGDPPAVRLEAVADDGPR